MAIQRTASDDLPVSKESYDQFIEDLCREIPQCWDDDVAVESIIVDYVRQLEARIPAGARHKDWCEWGCS